uniref:Putative secreted protein n=1 Tax=Anopheles nuneztovari TaxID=30067 RepID=A0A2M3YWV4_9DIPT
METTNVVRCNRLTIVVQKLLLMLLLLPLIARSCLSMRSCTTTGNSSAVSSVLLLSATAAAATTTTTGTTSTTTSATSTVSSGPTRRIRCGELRRYAVRRQKGTHVEVATLRRWPRLHVPGVHWLLLEWKHKRTVIARHRTLR